MTRVEPLPVVRIISRAMQNEMLSATTIVALHERGDPRAGAAIEWYCVRRFGHPLFDAVKVRRGFFSEAEWIHAKDLTHERARSVTADDLAVLAISGSAAARKIAAGHASTPPAILARLAADTRAEVRKAAGCNDATPAEALARMKDQSEVNYQRRRQLFLEVHTLPFDRELALDVASSSLFRDKDRLALARHPRVPVIVREALASFWGITPEVAGILASDEEAGVRVALANNRETPSEVLKRLAHDRSAAVRAASAGNRALPETSLEMLAHDPEREVRRMVVIEGGLDDSALAACDLSDESRGFLHERLDAEKWGWDADVLRQLAASPHTRTRVAVARNSHTPLDVIERLANDAEDVVRRAVVEGLGTDNANRYFGDGYKRTYLWWYRRDLEEDQIRSLARSDSLLLRAAIAPRVWDQEDLAALVNDSEVEVRVAVAGNCRLSFDDTVELANDSSVAVRDAIASSVSRWLQERQDVHPTWEDDWLCDIEAPPGLPAWRDRHVGVDRVGSRWILDDGYLDRLAATQSDRLRAQVAAYSGTTDGSEYWNSRDRLSVAGLVQLCQDPVESVRDAAFRNTGEAAMMVGRSFTTPPEVLAGFARSSSAEVRRAVAANPQTPRPALANLVRDRDETVRAAVAGNPRTPEDGLAVLTGDTHDSVRLELTGNPHAPRVFLEQEAARGGAGEYERHRQLARNASVPPDVLRRIAYSTSAEVRELVASHSKTPREALEGLAHDERSAVRAAAQKRLKGRP